MKGRLTCENVNSFISIVNSVLKQKYSIALLKRKEVKRKDLVHYSEWKSQEQEFAMIGDYAIQIQKIYSYLVFNINFKLLLFREISYFLVK